MSGCFGVERRPRAGPWGWLLFSQDLLDDQVFQTQFGVELLEAAVFVFQGLEPLRLAHAHAPELAFPTVKGGCTEAVLPANLGHGLTLVLSAQNAQNLGFAEATFFHK